MAKLTMTPFRREVLQRLADGPKTLDEARDGHPNILPTLIRYGLAQSVSLASDQRSLYTITEAGRRVLSGDAT